MAGEFLQTPVYLARRSYRQRRLRDAAKMVPIVGVILWLLPLVASAPRSGSTGLYIFGVWMALIFVTAGVSARLRDDPEQPEMAGDNTDPK